MTQVENTAIVLCILHKPSKGVPKIDGGVWDDGH